MEGHRTIGSHAASANDDNWFFCFGQRGQPTAFHHMLAVNKAIESGCAVPRPVKSKGPHRKGVQDMMPGGSDEVKIVLPKIRHDGMKDIEGTFSEVVQ